MTIEAIVVPRVVNTSRHRVTAASKVEALLALAPSTTLMMPLPRRDVFERLVEIVESVPAYRLELGEDVASVPAVLNDILDAG